MISFIYLSLFPTALTVLAAIGVASSTVVSQQGSRSSLTVVGRATSPPHTPLHCTGGVASPVSSSASCRVQCSSSGAGVHHRVLHLRASVSQPAFATLISLYHLIECPLTFRRHMSWEECMRLREMIPPAILCSLLVSPSLISRK